MRDHFQVPRAVDSRTPSSEGLQAGESDLFLAVFAKTVTLEFVWVARKRRKRNELSSLGSIRQ